MQKTEGNAVFFHRYVKMYMLGCYSLVFVLDVEPIKTVGFPFSPDLQDFKYVDADLVYLFACSASSVIKTCQSQAHQRTQRWARHPVLQPWMLNQLPTFGFHEKKKKVAGNDHLHLCQPVKSNPSPTKWTLSSPDMTGDFAHTCQSVSGAHLPTCPSTTPRDAILLLLALADERGTWCRSPPDSPKIDTKSCVLLGSSESSLSWHIVRKQRKVAICPGICHPNFKHKQDMIPLNLDQIPLSLQTSVTHCWRVWTSTSLIQDVPAMKSLEATFYFVHFLLQLWSIVLCYSSELRPKEIEHTGINCTIRNRNRNI